MMKRLLLALDGSFVLGLGLYMLFLSQAEAYSAFMNPGFRPITGTAGAGLCIIGAAFIVHPYGQTDLLRTLCFAVLGMLVLQAGSGSVESAGSFAVKPPPQTRIDPDPHLVRNGDTFLKTNPARLFLLLQTGQAAPSDQRYVTRGVVKRSAQLDQLGSFALLRGNIVCCLADAIAMGVMVAANGLPTLRDGEWVVAFGRVQPLPKPSPITDLGGTGEVPFSMVYDQAFLAAEAVEPMERPRFPFVFELPPSGKRPQRLTGGDDDY